MNGLGGVGIWTIQNHQVIKPMMTPERFYYDECESMIPNLYQLRSIGKASHFTAVRILHKLFQVYTPQNPQYIALALLRREFIDFFDMNKDFEMNLDVLLKHGLVEAGNRLDQYSESIDVVKLTVYGAYFYKELLKNFVYLDLICASCAMHSEGLANEISRCCNSELSFFQNKKPLERVVLRLEKVEKFISYLVEEEEREFSAYQLSDGYFRFSRHLVDFFAEQKKIVLKSANKNYGLNSLPPITIN